MTRHATQGVAIRTGTPLVIGAWSKTLAVKILIGAIADLQALKVLHLGSIGQEDAQIHLGGRMRTGMIAGTTGRTIGAPVMVVTALAGTRIGALSPTLREELVTRLQTKLVALVAKERLEANQLWE